MVIIMSMYSLSITLIGNFGSPCLDIPSSSWPRHLRRHYGCLLKTTSLLVWRPCQPPGAGCFVEITRNGVNHFVISFSHFYMELHFVGGNRKVEFCIGQHPREKTCWDELERSKLTPLGRFGNISIRSWPQLFLRGPESWGEHDHLFLAVCAI